MQRNNDEPSRFIVFMNVANTLTHWVLGAVAMSAFIYAIIIVGDPTIYLRQHIFLCVTGYVILMAQAVLAFSPHTGWSVSLTHQQKRTSHLVLQVIGSALAVTGSIIRIVNPNFNLPNSNVLDTPNFSTGHGILGLCAMIFALISLLGGVFSLYYTKKTVIIKIIHSCAGSLTLIVAFLALCLGFDRPFFREVMGDTISNLSIALTVIGLVGTLMSACISNGNRFFNR